MVAAHGGVAAERLAQHALGVRVNHQHLQCGRYRDRCHGVGQPQREAGGFGVQRQEVKRAEPCCKQHAQSRRNAHQPRQRLHPQGQRSLRRRNGFDQALRVFANLAVAESQRVDVGQARNVGGQAGLDRHARAVHQHRNHPFAGAQGGGDFMAHVVAWQLDAGPAIVAGQCGPERADDGHHDIAVLEVALYLRGEGFAVLDGLDIKKYLRLAKRCDQLGIERMRVHGAVVAPVADEDFRLPPGHRNSASLASAKPAFCDGMGAKARFHVSKSLNWCTNAQTAAVAASGWGSFCLSPNCGSAPPRQAQCQAQPRG